MDTVSELTTGMFNDIHEDIYRNFNAVSYSDLKAWTQNRTTELKPSPALSIGKALHALLLEPKTCSKYFITAPRDLDRRKKEDRYEYDDLVKKSGGKVVLLPRERKEVGRLLKAVKANPTAMKIIEASGDNEVSVVTQLAKGVPLSKCRVDMVRRGSIWDLKTTGAATPEEFKESINLFAYDAQAAYYADQVAAHSASWRPFGWIVVSKRSLLCWYEMAQPKDIVCGRRWYNDVLNLWGRHHD